MPNIKRKCTCPLGEFELEYRELTLDELDEHDQKMEALAAEFRGKDLLAARRKERVALFDIIHQSSTPLSKDRIPQVFKIGFVIQHFEYWMAGEPIDEKN